MNQISSQRVVKLTFSHEQIEEQKQFITDLESNNVNIAFEGSFDDGLSFLRDTGDLVDTLHHA